MSNDLRVQISNGHAGYPVARRRRSSAANTEQLASKFKLKMRKYCSLYMLKRRFPILEWLPKYKWNYLHSDLISGVTVALTVIPQGMAYANLAGLPLQYGLYTSFMGVFTYFIFGSTTMVHIGPTSMMAILILDHVLVGGVVFAVWLSFLSGIFEILLGVFRLGALVDFISLPVSSGFSSAASVIVIVNLLKSLLGLSFPSSSFLELCYKLSLNIPFTNLYDLSMGVTCLLSLIILKKISEKLKSVTSKETNSKCRRAFLSFCWFILTARNAFIVLLAAVIAYFLTTMDFDALTLSADVEPGLPHFAFPPLSVEVDDEEWGFIRICNELGWGLLLVPLVAILQHIAIAKSFTQGKTIDATQEVITLGLCNVFGSFVSAFPVTASFSRTALNVNSGIRTPLANIFTGFLVLIALAVMAPMFRFIPRACLSAVITYAVANMIEYEMIPQLWKTKKTDLVVWIVTFFGCLIFEAEYGILLGIFVSLLFLLYTNMRPRFHMWTRIFQENEVIVIEPDRALYFPSADVISTHLNKLTKDRKTLPVIIDGTHVIGLDYTSSMTLKGVIEDFNKHQRLVVFFNWKNEVLSTLNTVQPSNFIVCPSECEIQTLMKDINSKTLKNEVKSLSEYLNEDLSNNSTTTPTDERLDSDCCLTTCICDGNQTDSITRNESTILLLRPDSAVDIIPKNLDSKIKEEIVSLQNVENPN